MELLQARSLETLIGLADLSATETKYSLTPLVSKSAVFKTILPMIGGIMNVITRTAGMKRNRAGRGQAGCDRLTGSHLLLVDDIEINRDVIRHVLEKSRIRITSAHNGLVALEIFSAHPEDYDLILMDINMPEMDGHEASRRIRNLPNRWAHRIPILAITANAFAGDVKKSLDAGMNDHITKPVSFDILHAKLHHYLSKYTRNPDMNSKNETHPDVSDAFRRINTEGLIDVDDALKRLAGNTRVYKTILGNFLRHSGFDELEHSIRRHDTDAAIEAAHALKGTSGNLSLTLLYRQLATLEKSLREEDFRHELYEACRETYEKTRNIISLLVDGM